MPYIGYNLIGENDLEHFGILGMKWGVRRYRNKDGSLTPAGRKHYKKYSDDALAARSKDPRSMTDAELKKATTRMQQEAQYKEWRSKAEGPMRKGESAMGKYASQIAGIAVGAIATKVVNDTIKGEGWTVRNIAKKGAHIARRVAATGALSISLAAFRP